MALPAPLNDAAMTWCLRSMCFQVKDTKEGNVAGACSLYTSAQG